LSEASVYFRQLNGGPWFGINEDTLFTPGSLLKVPLIMSIYMKAEKDPTLLTKTILFEGGSALATEHYTSEQIEVGKIYSVEDLARATLVHSDNNATLLLTQLVDKDEIEASYTNLGITVPTMGQDYTMSVRTYASFFRILFNATYLNREHSNHLLESLTKAAFHDGLVAGLPKGVTVAHKFGERSYGNGASLQLHDCGIVYKARSPFLLCVMMRGDSGNYDTLAKNIQDIATLVYRYAE
jgi:beta-lactamase class A